MSPRRLALALLLAACGPQPGTTGDDAGTGTTATATATPTTGEPVTPAVCDGLDDVPIWTDTPECVDFPGQGPTGELKLAIINNRSEVVFIRGYSSGATGYLHLTGSPGGREVHAPFVCTQEPPACDDFIDPGTGGCLLNNKLSPPLRIEPGQRHHLTWQPLVVFPVIIPAACQADPTMDNPCTTSRVPTPGDYTLEITYAHADECTGECDCEPGPEGGCTLDRETSTLTGTPTRAQARYDGVCTVLDLVID